MTELENHQVEFWQQTIQQTIEDRKQRHQQWIWTFGLSITGMLITAAVALVKLP